MVICSCKLINLVYNYKIYFHKKKKSFVRLEGSKLTKDLELFRKNHIISNPTIIVC